MVEDKVFFAGDPLDFLTLCVYALISTNLRLMIGLIVGEIRYNIDLQFYLHRIRNGGKLIKVQAARKQIKSAKRILEHSGATSVKILYESNKV